MESPIYWYASSLILILICLSRVGSGRVGGAADQAGGPRLPFPKGFFVLPCYTMLPCYTKYNKRPFQQTFFFNRKYFFSHRLYSTTLPSRVDLWFYWLLLSFKFIVQVCKDYFNHHHYNARTQPTRKVSEITESNPTIKLCNNTLFVFREKPTFRK